MDMTITPWVIAVLAGLWLGFRARQNQRLWPLWSVGGGLFALVLATIVFGLRQATCIPVSDHARAMCHLEASVAAVLLTAGVGWLFTLSLSSDERPRAVEHNKQPASQPGGVPVQAPNFVPQKGPA